MTDIGSEPNFDLEDPVYPTAMPGHAAYVPARRRRRVKAKVLAALTATATSALALGALAIGALAIGRLVIAKADLKSMHVGRLDIDDLRVHRRFG